jgi:hypothetical protein
MKIQAIEESGPLTGVLTYNESVFKHSPVPRCEISADIRFQNEWGLGCSSP